MRALLLAAGLGKRLQPLTNNWPKCLMPINKRPLLEYWLEILRQQNISDIVVNTHHHSNIVKGFLNQYQYSDRVSIVYEGELLGTAGTIRNNYSYFKDDALLIIHADNWCCCDFSDFIAYHKNKFDRGYDKLIDILGADHHGYIPRMKSAIKSLGKEPENFQPIIHQLVHLIKDGKQVKMSKRAGEFLSLKGLMKDVGVDACRFFFALRTPNSHMNFDIDLAKKKSNENNRFY